MADIVIDKNIFQLGMNESPYVANGAMVNCDFNQINGILKIQYSPVNKSGTVVTKLIKWFVEDSSQYLYGIDTAGVLYRSTDSGETWATVAGQPTTNDPDGAGLAYWKGYILVFKLRYIDAYNVMSGTWTADFINSGLGCSIRPTFHSTDDKLYYGNGRYVGSIEEKSGQTFDPANAATFTSIVKALDLPSEHYVTALGEVGGKLAIGTAQSSIISPKNRAWIFPWDKTSSSFNDPLQITDRGVNGFINVNGLVYASLGQRPRFIATNLTSVTEIGKLPIEYSADTHFIPLYSPGVFISHQGELLVSPGTPVGAAFLTHQPFGLYAFNKKGAIYLKNTISTGTTVFDLHTQIGAALSLGNDALIFSWRDDASYGIDKVAGSTTTSYRYTGYKAYFESPVFRIGTAIRKRTFKQLEFVLGKELATGQGIRIKYRTNLTDNFTTLGTYDFATLGAILSHNVSFGVTGELIQIRCELTTGASSSTTPELLEIRLI